MGHLNADTPGILSARPSALTGSCVPKPSPLGQILGLVRVRYDAPTPLILLVLRLQRLAALVYAGPYIKNTGLAAAGVPV